MPESQLRSRFQLEEKSNAASEVRVRPSAALQVPLLRLLRQAQGQRQQASPPQAQQPQDLRRRSVPRDIISAI